MHALKKQTTNTRKMNESCNLASEQNKLDTVKDAQMEILQYYSALGAHYGFAKNLLNTLDKLEHAKPIISHANGEPLLKQSSSNSHSFPVRNDSACFLVCKWRQ